MSRDIEMVKWRDSVSLGGWQYKSDMESWAGRDITTVGFVVADNGTDLILAMSHGDAGAGEVLCNWISIPKMAILERVFLPSNAALCGPREAASQGNGD